MAGSHAAPHWRAASSATRAHRVALAMPSSAVRRTTVRSEMTGTMVPTPSSTAFSTVQSMRLPLLMQAKSVMWQRWRACS